MIKHEENHTLEDLTAADLNEDQAILDQILKLGALNDAHQVVTALKLAYFPMAGYVLKNPDDKGLELLARYGSLFKEVKDFVDSRTKMKSFPANDS